MSSRQLSSGRAGPRSAPLTKPQFWKQFFESSANVSLSGYEELVDGDGDTTAADESTAAPHDESASEFTARSRGADDTLTPGRNSAAHGLDDSSSLLSDGDGDLTGSTPRPPATKTLQPQLFAPLASPYETLRRELQAEQRQQQRRAAAPRGSDVFGSDDDDDDQDGDSTGSQLLAERTARLPSLGTPPPPPAGREESRRGKDPLLHRLLDKNYRIQATPHRGGVSPVKWKVTEKPAPAPADRPAWADSSPMSSPEMEAPKLRSAAFLSPVRAAYRRPADAAPRTPGVSVQTPAAAAGRKTRDVFAGAKPSTPGPKPAAGDDAGAGGGHWDSDSDEGLYGGLSPPKTIQFALPPSKLLQTPGTCRPLAAGA